MGTHHGDELVYGERIDHLVPAIEAFHEFLMTTFRGDIDNLARDFDLPSMRSTLAPAFRRALLRAQAKVLCEHADSLRDDGSSVLDGEDPELEAFRRIANEVTALLEECRHHPAGSAPGRPSRERHLVLVTSA